jgi:ATP/maltotriose-dependent transcriptional regulator MalT
MLANALVLQGEAALADGDLTTSLSLCKQSHSIFRDVSDRTGIAWAAADLGETFLLRGEIDVARDLAATSVQLARESAFPSFIVSASRVRAEVALADGDGPGARAYLSECLVLCRDVGHSERGLYLETPLLLETVARVAVAENAPSRALRLAVAAATQRTRLGVKIRPIDAARLRPALQRAEKELPDTARSQAWTEGLAMSVEQAIAYALNENST